MLDKMTVLTSLLFLLWFGITVSTVADLQRRILGGQDCLPQQHDYHVKLTNIHGELICGGSLISEWWILTSAHCYIWGMKVILGVHPGPGQMMIIHNLPEIYSDNNGPHDIMLLKLPKRTLYRNAGFPPLNCVRPPVGNVLETAGYASMITGPNHKREQNEAIHLQCGPITVTGYDFIHVGDTQYTANTFISDSQPTDVSPGDSGGGVEDNGVIYGLNTAIYNSSYAFSGINYFLDVCYYRDWINDTIIKHR